MIEDRHDGPLMDPDDTIDDIWQSKVFHDLKDAFGKPFMMPPPGEGRLIFSLSMDGFNPFHNKCYITFLRDLATWILVIFSSSFISLSPFHSISACLAFPYRYLFL